MKEIAYKTYFQLRELKSSMKKDQSISRKTGDYELANDYGQKVNAIDQCMHIIVNNFNLKIQ